MLSADAFCACGCTFWCVCVGGFEHAAWTLKIESSLAPCLFGLRELTESKKWREQLCLEALGVSLPHRGGASDKRKSMADIPERISSESQTTITSSSYSILSDNLIIIFIIIVPLPKAR